MPCEHAGHIEVEDQESQQNQKHGGDKDDHSDQTLSSATPRWADIDGRTAECLGSKILGFFLHRKIVLHRLHAGDLPDSRRGLGTDQQARHLAAQRHHACIGLGMDTGTNQRVVIPNLRNDPHRN